MFLCVSGHLGSSSEDNSSRVLEDGSPTTRAMVEHRQMITEMSEYCLLPMLIPKQNIPYSSILFHHPGHGGAPPDDHRNE